jgi:hypothetical protein
MTALVTTKDDAQSAANTLGAKNVTYIHIQPDLITNAGSASMLAQPALDNLETQIHHTARQLSAAQVNLLRAIQDACATAGQWLTSDPRFDRVHGLGRILTPLQRHGLIDDAAQRSIHITPLGELVADDAPKLSRLILDNKRYMQIMRNAVSYQPDDDWYEVWALAAGVQPRGSGHGLMGQMCAFGLFEHDGGPVCRARYRLTDKGRCLLEWLGLAIPPAPQPPLEDPEPVEAVEAAAPVDPQLTPVQLEALVVGETDVTEFDLMTLDDLVDLGYMTCYHYDSPWMPHDSYQITPAGASVLEVAS